MPGGRKCAVTILVHLPRGVVEVTRVGDTQPLYDANDDSIVDLDAVGKAFDEDLEAHMLDLHCQHCIVNELRFSVEILK